MELREALEQAVETSEAEAPVEVQSEAPVVETKPVEAQPTPERARDPKGKFATPPTIRKVVRSNLPPEKVVLDDSSIEPSVEAKLAETENKPQPVEQPKPYAKPPISWKPAAREGWAQLPDGIKQEVARRETEITRALQESSEARKQWTAIKETMSPFEAMLKAEGAEPVQAIGRLMQTAAALRMAPPQHKAQLVAGMIREFNIPIDALDAILAGQPVQQQQQQQPQQRQQDFRDPRLDQLLERMEQAEQHKSTSEIESFSQAHEFFEDVRADMGDVLEMAHKRGIAMTLEDAYKRAVLMHPEISDIMQQREAAQRAANPTGSAQRARLAASSIKSQPIAPMSGDTASDLRSQIKAAMDSMSR